jgi:hypothetical protein
VDSLLGRVTVKVFDEVEPIRASASSLGKVYRVAVIVPLLAFGNCLATSNGIVSPV